MPSGSTRAKASPSCWRRRGFRNVRHHGHAEALSDRDQDLGMMARRILLTADAPQTAGPQGPRARLQAHRRHRAHGRPAAARPGQARRHLQSGGPRDRAPLAGRAGGAAAATSSATSIITPRWSAISLSCAPTSCSICATKGWNNDPFKELHVPALLEVLGLPYTGAGPAALAACYDKGLVRAVAQ